MYLLYIILYMGKFKHFEKFFILLIWLCKQNLEIRILYFKVGSYNGSYNIMQVLIHPE